MKKKNDDDDDDGLLTIEINQKSEKVIIIIFN